MISHPGRTGSCIMPPRRAVSCLLKLNPPASTVSGKKSDGSSSASEPSFGRLPKRSRKSGARCPAKLLWLGACDPLGGTVGAYRVPHPLQAQVDSGHQILPYRGI